VLHAVGCPPGVHSLFTVGPVFCAFFYALFLAAFGLLALESALLLHLTLDLTLGATEGLHWVVVDRSRRISSYGRLIFVAIFVAALIQVAD
jgi:hypothetical protein